MVLTAAAATEGGPIIAEAQPPTGGVARTAQEHLQIALDHIGAAHTAVYAAYNRGDLTHGQLAVAKAARASLYAAFDAASAYAVIVDSPSGAPGVDGAPEVRQQLESALAAARGAHTAADRAVGDSSYGAHHAAIDAAFAVIAKAGVRVDEDAAGAPHHSAVAFANASVAPLYIDAACAAVAQAAAAAAG